MMYFLVGLFVLENKMKYSDVRRTIKSGDLLAWSHRRWKNWHDIKIQIVRFFTQSEYSHVGTAWVVGERVFVIEAVQPLVRIFPLSELGDFYFIPTFGIWNKESEEFALKQVGCPYTQLEAIKAFFSRLKPNGKWECAELCIAIAERMGVNLGTISTPTHVVLAAQRLGSATTYIQNP